MSLHYTHNYLLNPVHKVTIDVVGVGGTGSQVLTNLARMNEALIGLGHPGLHVRAWDPDTVTAHNLGRQLFSPSDLGMPKAIVLIQRINRFFGYDWQAVTTTYRATHTSNILITCVDTAKARIDIADRLKKNKPTNEPTDIGYYWLDIGNLQKTGQCLLGTLLTAPINKEDRTAKRSLKTVTSFFPQLKRIKEEKQGPSCSLAEALEKQDLFINSTLAQFGCNLLWKLIREGCIKYQGCYINLETLTVNPINI